MKSVFIEKCPKYCIDFRNIKLSFHSFPQFTQFQKPRGEMFENIMSAKANDDCKSVFTKKSPKCSLVFML